MLFREQMWINLLQAKPPSALLGPLWPSFWFFWPISKTTSYLRLMFSGEVFGLESTYAATKEEVSELLRQREILVSQLATIKNRTQTLQRVKQRRQDSFSRVTLARAEQRNSSINSALAELSNSASLVARCYSDDETRALGDAFVSGVDFTPYLDQEDVCLSQAQLFVKRRLASPTAIGDLNDTSIVSGESLDRGEDELLQDPSLAFLRGVDAETHARHCRELARLQATYVERRTFLVWKSFADGRVPQIFRE